MTIADGNWIDTGRGSYTLSPRQALVDAEVLEELLVHAYSMREETAVEGGCASLWESEWRFLEPDDPLVTLAVQAGVQIPGPMKPGTVPPAPPSGPLVEAVADVQNDGIAEVQGLTAATYRKWNDPRLRCVADDKVVYTNEAGADAACRLIGQRQLMRAYLGRCGHYHVSRVKGDTRRG